MMKADLNPAGAGQSTVLIVDDSLTVRMDLAETFEAHGFVAIPCGSLTEARDVLARSDLDVIVLDVLLPDGNGVDLLDEIRSGPRGTEISIVMLSSEADVADRIRGLETGADEYIGKPYDAGYLVAKVQELIRRRPDNATTVLVIDDSLTFRGVLREALQDAGYAVIEADTGEEGLRVAAARRPDAVIVDGVLPGIDGPTVIRHLRLDAALRDLPCLLLTGSDGAQAELRALDAGADAFVRKGEDLGVALARLAAMVRRSPARPYGRDGTRSLMGLRRILAVDDSATYLHSLAETLSDEGYDVIMARSGEEALQLLAVQPVDCILLDVMMPGLSGGEVCARVKAAPVVRDIPIVMLTSRDDREAMIEGLSAGADDYVLKSSESEVLKARVRAQIRRKQFEDENRRIREQLLHKELEAAEARASRQLAETRAALVDELERKNRELEAFSYSVSHDLRAPLRAIDGFSRMAMDEAGEALQGRGLDYLVRVRGAAKRMSELIDDLLALSRVGRAELHRSEIDLSSAARDVVSGLQKDSDRQVDVAVQPDVRADADRRLLQIVLENLIGNAWKFTSMSVHPRIEFGATRNEGGMTYFVRDNGAGFDMEYAGKLFRPFQRLHTDEEFPGTGIGLATVHRIVERHGGRVWAEGEVGRGAAFLFTLPPAGTGQGGR